MKQYPEEFKNHHCLPPRNVSVTELARETGIPRDTLYTWRIKTRKRQAATLSKNTDNDGFSSEDKFNIVLETAIMNETELSAYCRRKGLYPEQING